MDFEEEPQSRIDHERVSISIVQQHGRFRRAIPCMPMGLAVFCCILNLFLPGLGTGLAAFSVFCCVDSRFDSAFSCFATNITAAFLQLLLAPVVIGFVWSVIWGILFVQIAQDKQVEKRIAERQKKQQPQLL